MPVILSCVGTPIAVPEATRQALRVVSWTVAYVAAYLLGRSAVDESSGVALLWPAAGVGFLWLATSPSRRALGIDLLLMGVGGAAVRAALGDGWFGVALSQITAVECLVALLALRRLVPGTWGAGGRRMLRLPVEFGRFLVAMALAALAGALLRGILRLLYDDGVSWWSIPERIGRDGAALVGIGTLGLLLGGWLAERREAPAGSRPTLHWTRGRAANAAAVIVLTTSVFGYGYVLEPQAPSTTFLLTLLTVWVAIAFEPLLVAAYCLTTGATGAFLTVFGIGPIAGVTGDVRRALITQVFVIVLMVIGMTIALTRAQLLQAIANLRDSEAERGARAEELGLLVEHLADGVAIIEQGGRIVHTNSKLRQIVAVGGMDNVDELEHGTLVRGFAVYGRDGAPVAVEDRPSIRALAGEVVTGEEYLLTGDPNGTVVQISAVPLPQAKGAPPRAMVMLRDVTAETRSRETLVAFAGTVAHDLNNPLTVVEGWTESLEDLLYEQDSVPTEAAMPMLQNIRAAVRTMTTFVADLLAHAVARDQAIRGEQVSLDSVVKRVMLTHDRPDSPSQVHTEALSDVWADRLLVQQLFDNLIGNALKYARPGVVPEVTVTADRLQTGWTCIRVCDNGVGIPAEQRDLVFRSFHRVDPAHPGGTGLGLSICKRIVERHGGTIRALANPRGHGTCFELILPTTQESFERAADGCGG